MAQFILYGYWRSSCSYRVRIALNHKQIPYEHRAVHLVKDGGQQHTEEYRKLNPMGQVPCLVDAQAQRGLTQSMAIFEYLEHFFPEPALFPKDTFQAMRVRECCELINSGIQPLQNLAVLQTIERDYGADADAKARWAAGFIERGFAAMESLVAPTAGAFCFGDTLSAADCFLIPQVYGANRFGVDMDRFPTLKRIDAHCLELDAFKKAEPGAQPDAQ